MATIGVGPVIAEGGDFGHGSLPGDIDRDEDDAEGGSDRCGAGKHVKDDVGGSGGGDVVVLGAAAEQEIAYAAAGEECLVAASFQGAKDLPGGSELRSGRNHACFKGKAVGRNESWRGRSRSDRGACFREWID